MVTPKKRLLKVMPYPPGKTIDELRKELGLMGPIIKMNSNENPLGPSPKVLKALEDQITKLHLYPQASYQDLKQAIAKRWQVKPEQIILGNGSNEVIEFIFKAFLEPDDEILLSQPSFLMYQRFAQIFGITVKGIPLTRELKHNLVEIKRSLGPRSKAVFLDHPHNPTGSTLKRTEWEEFLRDLPKGLLLVLDEAYGEFVEDPEVPMGVEWLKKGYPILVLRTFSKAYGLAGLRLGYGITHEEIAEYLERVRQPFNLNLLANHAGWVALEDEEHLQRTVEIVIEGRRYLSQELSRLGFKVYPSQANFLMVDFGEKTELIYETLLRRGLILRPLKAYGFPTCLRITIGLPQENKILVDLLGDIINKI